MVAERETPPAVHLLAVWQQDEAVTEDNWQNMLVQEAHKSSCCTVQEEVVGAASCQVQRRQESGDTCQRCCV